MKAPIHDFRRTDHLNELRVAFLKATEALQNPQVKGEERTRLKAEVERLNQAVTDENWRVYGPRDMLTDAEKADALPLPAATEAEVSRV